MDKPQAVLVTGSSSGFGRLTVETLACQGHRVFASMRDIQGKNAPAKTEIETLARQENLSVQVIELDVTDDASVESAVASVIAQAGRIDVAVNNAGLVGLGVNEAFTLPQMQRMFDTNFFGAVRVNRAVLPHMRRQGSGLLVHRTSTSGRIVFPFGGVYSATKFALEALAEAYHLELAPLGIDSIIVEPGMYPTNIGKNALVPADQQRSEAYVGASQGVAQMGQIFQDYLSRSDAPQSQEVADAIARLIAFPAGQRPLRTLVGPDARLLERLNQVAAEMQEEELRWLGLGDLSTARPAR